MPQFVGRLRSPLLTAAPASPVKGEMYMDSVANVLYWWNGTAWISASGGAPSGAASGDLGGSYPSPIALAELGASGISSAPWTVAGTGNCAATPSFRTPGSTTGGQESGYRYVRNTVSDSSNRRLSLFYVSRDTANWQYGGPIIIEVFTQYYAGGGYTRSIVSGGYSSPLRLEVTEASGTAPMRPTLTAEAVVAGNIREAHCYIDFTAYMYAIVKITFSHRAEIARPFNAGGQMAWTFVESVAGSGQGTPGGSKQIAFDEEVDVAMQGRGVGSARVRIGNTFALNGQDWAGIYFGGPLDTNLYRPSADVLKTDDTFVVGGSLNTGTFVNLPNAGVINWGSDVKLYRLLADILMSDDALRWSVGNTGYTADGLFNALARPGGWYTPAGSSLMGFLGYADNGAGAYVPAIGFAASTGGGSRASIGGLLILQSRFLYGTPETTNVFQVSFDGKHEWGPGGSTNPDTNLYRSAADILKTDDTFQAANIPEVHVQAAQPSPRTGVLWVDTDDVSFPTGEAALRFAPGADSALLTQNQWNLLPINGAVFKSADADGYFRVNADGTVTVLQTGWYQFGGEILHGGTPPAASIGVSAQIWATTDDTTPANPNASIARSDTNTTTSLVTYSVNMSTLYNIQAGTRLGLSIYHRDSTTRAFRQNRFWIQRIFNGWGMGGPTFVSALPPSPYDGQEVYYLADATNGVVWHLRYRAAAGTYKWEFLGGSPLQHEITTQENPGTATTWVNLATNGPLVTVPLAGVYTCQWGARIQLSVRNILGYCGLAIGDTTPTQYINSTTPDPTGAAWTAGAQAGNYASRMRWTLAAGNILKHRYYGTQATGSNAFSDRWLDVTPIRVG